MRLVVEAGSGWDRGSFAGVSVCADSLALDVHVYLLVHCLLHVVLHVARFACEHGDEQRLP